jgi:hypothetical protein
MRAPAEGVSKERGRLAHDDMVVIEVMTETLDHAVCDRYRLHLERKFERDEILIRATIVQKL